MTTMFWCVTACLFCMCGTFGIYLRNISFMSEVMEDMHKALKEADARIKSEFETVEDRLVRSCKAGIDQACNNVIRTEGEIQ